MQEKFTTLLNDYTSVIILFTLMLLSLLLYLTLHYKKMSKKQSTVLDEKDAKIKSLRQYSYEMELKRVDREHEIEKEILNLNHVLKEFETKQKEGVKSHVVNMIEAHEKKRTQQLEIAAIKR
ncbi:MAG: Unknown protein [uncultured Sulfurovum sp.]|uniref:Uncharacterized protein n=1 Tax=uncultured Sulfurovum sp. TaxID=269237 RepID=A0A6S6S370_9BACT|nr:MAG: Unknown protein [uncultured Sulfurovum sp.]